MPIITTYDYYVTRNPNLCNLNNITNVIKILLLALIII